MGADTWRNSGGADAGKWDVPGNWLGASVPGNGDTASFDGGETGGLPDANLPAAGTVSFMFLYPYTTQISDMLDGAAIGGILVDAGGATIVPGADWSQATIHAGTLYAEGDRSSAAATSVEGPGYLTVRDGTLTGDVSLDGGQLVLDDGVVCGAVTAQSDSLIDWCNVGGIVGSLDAGVYAIEHLGAEGGLLECTVTADLDLGGAAAGLDVAIDSDGGGITVTLAASLSVGRLTVAAGDTLDADGQAVALAAGERVVGTGTLTGAAPTGPLIVAEGVRNGGGNGGQVHFCHGATHTGTGTGR